MVIRNTTSAIGYRRHRTLCLPTRIHDRTKSTLAQGLSLKVLGIHQAMVGKEWDSDGRDESDCLHHINLVCGGRARVVHNGRSYDLRPGLAYLFPGNVPLQRHCRRRYETIWIVVRCEWFPGIDALLEWPGRRPLELGPWDQKEWNRDWSDGKEASFNAFLRLQGRLMRWFADAIPDLEDVVTRHIRLHAACDSLVRHLRGRLSARLRVSELARENGSTLAAFSAAFCRSTGIGPKAFIDNLLNQEIIDGLIGTTRPLKQIASDFGFADQYHFHRFFARLNGQSPAQFRKRMHGR